LDALSPDEKKKKELMEDPAFKKWVTAYKMKIPLSSIRQQI